MSCCPTTGSTTTSCDPENEPLASSLNNFITTFYGTVSKTCVNGQVVWTLPCDLTAGSSSFPRNSGEGLACYFNRFVTAFGVQQQYAIGNKGYRLTTLAATDVVLYRSIDVVNQDFTGTLTGPVRIFISSNGATAGDEFYIFFTNLVISATNTLTVLSDATTLLTLNTPGTVNGLLRAIYTGTAWDLSLTSINIT